MSNSFDPYRVWLGIPPGEQPANHYRLLGAPLFEEDLQVIGNAADKACDYVKKFLEGPYAEAAERILAELQAARVCLFDGAQKACYDDSLRDALGKASTAGVLRLSAAHPHTIVRPPPRPDHRSSRHDDAAPTIHRPAAHYLASPPTPARVGTASTAAQLPATVSPADSGVMLLPGIPLELTPQVGEPPKSAPETAQLRAAHTKTLKKAQKLSSVPVPIVAVLAPANAPLPAPVAREVHDADAPPAESDLSLLDPARLVRFVCWLCTRQSAETRYRMLLAAGFGLPLLIGLPIAWLVLGAPFADENSPAKTANAIAHLPINLEDEPSDGSNSALPLVEVEEPRTPAAAQGPDQNSADTSPEEPPSESASLPKKSTDSAGNESNTTTTSTQPKASYVPPPPEKPARSPIPNSNDQYLSRAQIQLLLSAEYKLATDRPGKAALAARLLRYADDPDVDAKSRYVSLREAFDMAASAGEYETARKATSTLVERYWVNELILRCQLIEKLERSISGPDSRRKLVADAIALVEPLCQAEDFEEARKMAQASVKLAAFLGPDDVAFKKSASSAVAEVQAQVARHTLKTEPANTAANQRYGLHLCLVRHDFASGITYLAKGEDGPIKAAAKLDLGAPRDAVGKVRVGEMWFQVARSNTTLSEFYSRAEEWFELALFGLPPERIGPVQARLNEIRRIKRSAAKR